jgi:diadenosine tetraphosphate (Ap4A) HIT family hydrolase
MRQGFEGAFCQFCAIDSQVNNVLWEDTSTHCWAVPDAFMRTELEYHLIVAPKRHVRFPWELGLDEEISINEAQRFLASKFDLRGGIIATRFGDMSLNAGTVPHLHINIMVPNGTGEVRIPVFKDPCDREENQKRAAKFAEQYEKIEAL